MAYKDTKGGFSMKTIYMWSALAAVMLIIANSALWVNRYIFNTENFTKTAGEAITSQSSRDAIAAGITNQIFENRPASKQFLGDKSKSLISGLLDTETFRSATDSLVSRFQIYSTTSNQESIVLDLTGTKNTISRIVDIANIEQAQNLENLNIPDEIVVIDEANFPDLYNYSVAMLWLGPVALVLAIFALVYPYRKYAIQKLEPILMRQGFVITLGAVVALLIGPLFKPIVLSGTDTLQRRIVAENIYNAFITTFNQQVYWLFAIAAGFIGYALVRMYLNRKKV